MKIALAQLNYHIGHIAHNQAKILTALKQAELAGMDLVVFSELAICGYPPLDLLEFDAFIQQCEQAIQELATACTHVAAIVGGPSRNPRIEGKNLFNSAYFLYQGKVAQLTHKGLLPNYDVFDEYRYFEASRRFETIAFKGVNLAVTICEDLWDVEEDLMYLLNPMDELNKQQPQVMINVAASPFTYRHAQERKRVLRTNVTKYNLPLFYVNQVGANTELVFDGGSMVMQADGSLLDELHYFKEDLRCYEVNPVSRHVTALQKVTLAETSNESELIYQGLLLGIRDYFTKMGFKKAILGLSGGIDSALVAVLATHALGKENVYAILLPSKYSSNHSIDDAKDLAENLGIAYDTLPIQAAVHSLEDSLKPFFKNLPADLTEENLQARTRGILLMALSNKFGHILLNTTNKSEAAVGYGTLYGDMCGGLAVLGDVYKTQAFALARHLNAQFNNVIPQNTLVKPPSAELRENQKDSDSLPDYDVLDAILNLYLEERKGPAEIIVQGFDSSLVYRVLNMVNSNEYKRKQMAPIIRVSPKAFGMGRRMPIVGNYFRNG